jgi:hypothetical protein
MDDYQRSLYEKFTQFLTCRDDAPYPPAHKGEYLEEYFVRQFLQDEVQYDRYFIPIHWTAVFNYKVKEGLHKGSENWKLRQALFVSLQGLDHSKKYFTVSTHDDAPQGNFEYDVKHFYAGGRSELPHTFPIPVIWSGFEHVPDIQKMIFCSFIGSITHDIRPKLLVPLHKKDGYIISAFEWIQDVPEDRQKMFQNILWNSRFTLCPRGYGATSYRMYEAIQAGSIPVYVSDKFVFAWEDELDWSEFCVIIPEDKILETDSILRALTETQVRDMQSRLKEVYPEYFTIPAAYKQIIKRVT